MSDRADMALYSRYPLWSVALYDGLTAAHFTVGAVVLGIAYPSPVGWILGIAYAVLAFLELFVLMPLTVCPSCVYYRIDGALCISGMNRWSRRIAGPRDPSTFPDRARGVLCSNNLYLAALSFPIAAALPGLIVSFSPVLLSLWAPLIAMLVFRFFVVFPRVACGHCRAKNACPNARSMGLS